MKPVDQNLQSCQVMGKSKAAKVAAFVVHALAMQGSHSCMVQRWQISFIPIL